MTRVDGFPGVLARQIRIAGMPAPIPEYRFHPVRRWRFDLAWPDLMIAVEIEGGIWAGGRHIRGGGYEADCEKYNEAQLAGWRVFRFTTGQVEDGRALEFIQRVLAEEG